MDKHRSSDSGLQSIRPQRATLPVAIAAALACTTAFNAFASGFSLLEHSASRLGTAFAGTAATADDSTTIFYNPAGLTLLSKPEVAAVVSGIDIRSEFHNANSQPALGQPLGNEGGDAGDFAWVPSAYWAAPISERISLGFAVNAPFGLKTEYQEGWMGRFQALKSEIKTYNFNPAIAFRPNEWLSIGIGADYQKLQAEFTSAVNYTAVIAQGVQQLVSSNQLSPASAPAVIAANSGLEGRASVRGDDAAWGYNAGVLFDWKPTGTKLGLSYRSSINYETTGVAEFMAPTVSQATGAAIVANASAASGPLATSSALVRLRVPNSATLSVSQQVTPEIEILTDVAWTGWSSVQELRVVDGSGATLSVTPEQWRDTWRFALGGAYQASPAWKLRLGVAYDNAPVPGATSTPRLPDSDRIWTATGARWLPTESLAIDLGYAHLFMKDAPLDQNNGSTGAYGLLNGKQSSGTDIASVQFAFRF